MAPLPVKKGVTRMSDILANKTTTDGLDMLAAMLPHLDTILHDEEFNRIRSRVKDDASLTLADVMSDAFHVFAVKNRPAMLGIVSAATGKTPDQVAAQPLEETLTVFQGVMGARTLDFFTYCARLAARM